jgi:hypothetical protein
MAIASRTGSLPMIGSGGSSSNWTLGLPLRLGSGVSSHAQLTAGARSFSASFRRARQSGSFLVVGDIEEYMSYTVSEVTFDSERTASLTADMAPKVQPCSHISPAFTTGGCGDAPLGPAPPLSELPLAEASYYGSFTVATRTVTAAIIAGTPYASDESWPSCDDFDSQTNPLRCEGGRSSEAQHVHAVSRQPGQAAGSSATDRQRRHEGRSDSKPQQHQQAASASGTSSVTAHRDDARDVARQRRRRQQKDHGAVRAALRRLTAQLGGM